MERKHTPGPWGWQKIGSAYHLVAQHGMREIIIGANPDRQTKQPIPVMNEDGILRPINPEHPNAILIAAAPATAKERDELKTLNAELLEVLEKIAPYIEDLQKENFTDASVGIFEDGEQTKVYIRMRETIKKAKGQ